MKRARILSIKTARLIGTWLALIGLASVCQAQWPEVHPPSDSIYWWSLSPDLSPEELQERLAEEDGHQRRYLEALAQKRAAPMSDERLAQLDYYVNGALTPELMRISSVFEAFCRRFDFVPDWDEVAPRKLREHGVSDAGVRTIVQVAQAAREERTTLWEELEPLRLEFGEMKAEAEENLDVEALRAALATRDIATLARASGRSESEVRELGKAWERDPEEVATAGLELLHERLAAQDWRSLVAFLTREVASNITSMGYKETYP